MVYYYCLFQLKTMCREADEGKPTEHLKEKLFQDLDMDTLEMTDDQ